MPLEYIPLSALINFVDRYSSNSLLNCTKIGEIPAIRLDNEPKNYQIKQRKALLNNFTKISVILKYQFSIWIYTG
jgi:hypothetical protein